MQISYLGLLNKSAKPKINLNIKSSILKLLEMGMNFLI